MKSFLKKLTGDQSTKGTVAAWGWFVVAGSLALSLIHAPFESNVRLGRIIFGALAIIAMFAGVAGGWLDRAAFRRFLWPILAVYTAILVSCFFSIDSAYSLKAFQRQHLWFGLLFLTAASWGFSAAAQRVVLIALTVSGVLAAIPSIVLYYHGPALMEAGWIENSARYIYTATDEAGNVYQRARGMLYSYTRSGLVYLFCAPALVVLAVASAREKRYGRLALLVLVAVVFAWFLLLTKTRGVWLATLLSATLAYLFVKARIWPLLLAGVLLLVALAAMPVERERALTMLRHANNPDLLLSYRLSLWKQGYKPIREHLWTGIGYGPNIFLSPKVAEAGYALETDRPQPDLHNSYLQTLAEVGIVGVIAYAWLLGFLLWRGWKLFWQSRGDPLKYGASLAALAAFITTIPLGVIYYYNEQNVGQIMWTIFGLIAISLPQEAAPTIPAEPSQDA